MNSLLALLLVCSVAAAQAYTGGFSSKSWLPLRHAEGSTQQVQHLATSFSFHVAMRYQDQEQMEEEFLAVSTPSHARYGQHLSADEIRTRYVSAEGIEKVKNFFADMEGSEVEVNQAGSMIKVTSSVASIQRHLSTTITLHRPEKETEEAWLDGSGTVTRGVLKADEPLTIPAEIENEIAFISLNTPSSPAEFERKKMKAMTKKDILKQTAASSSFNVTVLNTNTEAIVKFQPICNNTGLLNIESPPCDSTEQFDVYVEAIAANVTAEDAIYTDPIRFYPHNDRIQCFYEAVSGAMTLCDGTVAARNAGCYCYANVSPLPKYQQLRAVVLSQPVGVWGAEKSEVGSSYLFVNTDTATAPFLKDLYNIPKGLTVRHGSTQACAEFYGEFYSNSDLSAFLALSGLENASIPESNCFGDLPNDQNNPGGEAQLDVEYIMALAPGADTFFYSMADLQYDPSPFGTIDNEGFLSYLYIVGNQTNPPLVHSLSYGDEEANVFNASTPGAIDYGTRCDQEFMAMGLRGLSVLFSSGDDGIGGDITRTDASTTYPGGCSQAWPSWPAASPYVTSVGGTQVTDQYLPFCKHKYDYDPFLGTDEMMDVTCSGVAETVCSSSIGGVITSGGGFSNVSPRQTWQSDAVEAYLSQPFASLPPEGYFNASGRGYPDISTYASNYFVYLSPYGAIRESGTSASAPVMAAMVTLWNDLRLAYGMPPMGFINPFLYAAHASNPEAFNDVVTGNNACSAGSSIELVNCCEYSFHATPGWDAASGLGSPNFGVLSNLVLNPDAMYPSLGLNTNPQSGSGSNDDDDDVEGKEAKDIGIAALCLALMAGIGAGATFYLLNRKMNSNANGMLREGLSARSPILDSNH